MCVLFYFIFFHPYAEDVEEATSHQGEFFCSFKPKGSGFTKWWELRVRNWKKKCWIELHLINSEFAKKIVGEVS